MHPLRYEESEKDGIVGNIRDEAVKRGSLDSKEGVWNYFVGKCRDNLHVILAMSPVGETLRVRCRSFPGMVNNTVIDWFVPWPEQALLSVAGVRAPSTFLLTLPCLPTSPSLGAPLTSGVPC